MSLTNRQKSLFNYPNGDKFESDELVQMFLKSDLSHIFGLKSSSEKRINTIVSLIKNDLYKNYPILRYINPSLVDDNFKKVIAEWKNKNI